MPIVIHREGEYGVGGVSLAFRTRSIPMNFSVRARYAGHHCGLSVSSDFRI